MVLGYGQFQVNEMASRGARPAIGSRQIPALKSKRLLRLVQAERSEQMAQPSFLGALGLARDREAVEREVSFESCRVGAD